MHNFLGIMAYFYTQISKSVVMQRILLTFFISAILSVGAIAQVEISPEVIVLEADMNSQIFISITITNNTDEVQTLYWNYEPGDTYPENWKSQICDLNLCYAWDAFASSNALPNEFPIGESKVFTLKIKNNVDENLPISGTSYGILELYTDPDRTDLAASTEPLVTSTTDRDLGDVVIYPNPTTESFQLKNDENIAKINVYNIVGRLVSTMNHSSGMVHDVTSLRTGMYLVRLENRDGDVVKSMRLSKR